MSASKVVTTQSLTNEGFQLDLQIDINNTSHICEFDLLIICYKLHRVLPLL